MPHYWQGKHKRLNRGEAVGITYLELWLGYFLFLSEPQYYL